jgi:hypothetical protein
VSGFEPLTCRLQEVRHGAMRALPAQIAQPIALLAPAELGLSGRPFHDPFHTGRRSLATLREVSPLYGPGN